MPPADHEARQAAVERLGQLRAAGDLTAEHVRLAAAGLGLSERSMWRLLSDGADHTPRPRGPAAYELSETDREAYAHYGANIAAVHPSAAGVPIPEFLRQGWAGAEPVTLRTLQRAFTRALSPAERAGWSSGEQARREAGVYLVRPAAHRNQVWEADHKKLPILVLPPRGPAVCPWLTTIVDDGTRALLGWALALTPHAGTVLTALRMALVCDAERGPFGAIPALVRIDRGLEFAAAPVREALAALCVEVLRLPARQPHRKGKIERLHRTIDQTLLSGLPGFTEGPRDVAGKLYGPLDDRAAARAAAPDQAVQPMRIEHFAAHFASWVAWYNTMRPHSALDGRTRCRRGTTIRPRWLASAPSGCAICCWPASSAPSARTACACTAWPMSLPNCRAAAASRCRCATCRTTTVSSRSTSTASTCAPRTRKAS